MKPAEKRIRRLLYLLTELESALRASGRKPGAESMGAASKALGSPASAQFLGDCREALEAVLLGERGLEAESIGLLLDAMGLVDEMLSASTD